MHVEMAAADLGSRRSICIRRALCFLFWRAAAKSQNGFARLTSTIRRIGRCIRHFTNQTGALGPDALSTAGKQWIPLDSHQLTITGIFAAVPG